MCFTITDRIIIIFLSVGPVPTGIFKFPVVVYGHNRANKRCTMYIITTKMICSPFFSDAVEKVNNSTYGDKEPVLVDPLKIDL